MKSLCYFALYDHKLLKGVHMKIKTTVEGFNRKGIKSVIYGFENTGSPTFFKMVLSICFSSYSIYIIRSVSYFNIFLIPSIIFARLRGVYVIVDIPTPFRSALSEVKNTERNYILQFFKLISTLVGGFLISLVCNLVINYGDDFTIFHFLFKKKNLISSNFLSEDVYKVRSNFPTEIKDRLELIAVGNFASSQGYDVVLDALDIWNHHMNEDYKIYLKLIGSGNFDDILQLKLKELKIEEFVEFLGYKDFGDYKVLYNDSHIAIGSIASFRKNLNFHSPIKEREYSFVGIPFISSIKDVGFKDECNFRLTVQSNNSVGDLIDIFKNSREICKISPKVINSYARENLTFETFYLQLKEKLALDKIYI